MKYFKRFRSPKDYTIPEATVASYIPFISQAIVVNSTSGRLYPLSPPVTNEVLANIKLNKWEI